MGLLKVLSYKNSVEILEFVKDGAPEGRRFMDIQKGLNLNPNTVSRCLGSLRGEGLVEKYDSFYRITNLGVGALRMVRELRSL